jgi:hypothetical protein
MALADQVLGLVLLELVLAHLVQVEELLELAHLELAKVDPEPELVHLVLELALLEQELDQCLDIESIVGLQQCIGKGNRQIQGRSW